MKIRTLLRGAVAALALLSLTATAARAESYRIDPTHSFIQFSISHLGYSLLQGRFNHIDGEFDYVKGDPKKSRIRVRVETASVDSNHAKRDKHLRAPDFLDVGRFPQATFVSESFTESGKKGVLKGNLTLHGVSKPVTFDVDFIGAGPDPWGGHRRGYKAHAVLKRSDFGIVKSLGPAAETLELTIFIEGIRK